MDLREYIDMNDDIQDAMFESMKNRIINDTFTESYIYSSVYNEFAEVGIDLKNFECEYNIEEREFKCNMKITKNDIKLNQVIENLFLYSAITSTEYLLIKEIFEEDTEIESGLYLNIVKEINNEADVTLLLDCVNPNIQYILATTIDSLLSTMLFKIEKQINDKHEDLSISRILVFKEYSERYNIDLLYNDITNGGENLNV